MLFTCVICAELLNQSDDAYVTLCGHIFHFVCLCRWFERSQTCPQCRNKCSLKNIHRVYFNIANLETDENNIGLLQQQLDNANLKIKTYSKELEEAKNQIQSHITVQKKTVKTVLKLEDKVQKSEHLINTYEQMIKTLKFENKVVEDQKKEIATLKQRIDLMSTVQMILDENGPKIEKLLKEQNDPKILAVWVTTLRRELRQCENKKTDLRKSLHAVQNDLRKVQEEKSTLEEKVISLESENYQLLEKVKSSENAGKNESLCDSKLMVNEVDAGTPVIDLTNPKTNPKKSLSKISPKILERVTKIENADSPYFNIKSSAIGLNILGKFKERNANEIVKTRSQILKRNHSDLSEKYNIMKKPRLLSDTIQKQNSELVFDGFGTSEKKEISAAFLDKKKFSLNERIKSGKIKKLN